MINPAMHQAPSTVTMKDLAEILTLNKKDLLPDWNLAKFNGNPLQWHEWYGQFKSAIDSQALSDDIKLTYLKTLVVGKATDSIAEFAYCGKMYRDALKTLERKFGQPQAVVTAHLDKLANYPSIKMHSSDQIIHFSTTVSSLVAVFRSLSYDADLQSSSLLIQAVQKLPPNLKKLWSLHTVKRDSICTTMLDFNDWLKERAEGHDRMKTTSFRSKPEDTNSNGPKCLRKYSRPTRSPIVLIGSLKVQRMITHLAYFVNHNIRFGDVRLLRKKLRRSVLK